MIDHLLSDKERRAFLYIRDTLIHRGSAPSVRALQDHLGYGSPRAAAYIIEKLEEKGYVSRPRKGTIRISKDLPDSDNHAQTVKVPLVGSAPCGKPVFSEENIEALVPVSKRLVHRSSRYFLLRATGDSMTEKGIQEGNLVLVRQQSAAENGDVVVALIDGEATIKEFHRTQNAVILKPRSNNPKHHPIILTEDFLVLGIIQSIIHL